MKKRIEITVNNWFDETVLRINESATDDTPVDNLLCAAIPLAHNYCNAVFLLADKHKLPAMALLRILAELAIKLAWCLYEDNPNGESPQTRIERWLKATNAEHIKLLKKMEPLGDKQEKQDIQKTIAALKGENTKNPHKCMGSFYNSLSELPPLCKEKLYPLLYGRFNCAIHPDLKLVFDLIKRNGKRTIYVGDLQEFTGEELKIYAMTAAFNILAIARLHYEWDYKSMKSEYLAVKKQAAENK